MKRLVHALFFLASSLLLPACDLLEDYGLSPKQPLTVYRGPSVKVGNGQATAWISVNARQEPVELGMELTNESLYNLPPTNFSVEEIPLPARAQELTPFDHIQLGWSAQGHVVAGPNGLIPFGPHYDTRFFMTTVAERQAIPAGANPTAKFNVLPPAGYMPAPYQFVLSDIPGFGRHWGDGSAFVGMTHTMVLGSYNGRYTFMVPNVLLEELRSGNRSSTPFAQPLYFQETNTYYPTTYNVYATGTAPQTHHITLSGFVRR
jgi:hypothetical protein